MNTQNLEKNISGSFQKVKDDINKMQSNLAILTQNQERIIGWLNDTIQKEKQLYEKMSQMPKKISSAPKARKFVASRRGTKVHDSTCPFAKNIKPKSKVTFSGKSQALNQGYKSCECLKR